MLSEIAKARVNSISNMVNGRPNSLRGRRKGLLYEE